MQPVNVPSDRRGYPVKCRFFLKKCSLSACLSLSVALILIPWTITLCFYPNFFAAIALLLLAVTVLTYSKTLS